MSASAYDYSWFFFFFVCSACLLQFALLIHLAFEFRFELRSKLTTHALSHDSTTTGVLFLLLSGATVAV